MYQMQKTPKSKLQNKSRYPKKNELTIVFLLTPKELSSNCCVQSIFPFFL